MEKSRGLCKIRYLDGVKYNAVEQYVDKSDYFSVIKDTLERKCQKIFGRQSKNYERDRKEN